MATSEKMFRAVKRIADLTGYPVFNAENYTSWFGKWGRKSIPRFSPARELEKAKWLFDRDINYCYYMFHGGTTSDSRRCPA